MPLIPENPVPAPALLAALTFGAPLLAWGLLACAIPVIIHLALRRRPRRQVFPAMRFLLASHEASRRAQRVRQVLLLASRMAIILLAVGMLMKTGCAPGGAAPRAAWLRPEGAPVSAVLCLDDSASMGYRFQGASRLQRARDWARSLLEDRGRFGPGSQMAVLSGSAREEEREWLSRPRAGIAALDRIRVADHARPVSVLIERACGLLATAAHDRREIYLFTDLAESSWPRRPPTIPDDLSAVYVLDVGQEENRNVALSPLTVSDRTLTAGAPMTVTVRVRAGDLPAECSLELRIDGELRSRQRVTPLGPDTELEVPVVLPGLAEGTHAVTIDLEPADALACDNRRFAAVAVRDAPTILVVGPANGAEEVASMVAAMIAPADPAAGVSQHRVQRRPDDELAHGDLRRVLALFLADTGPLPEDARAAVARYVEAGGALVMIPGPNTAPALFESLGSLMPADVESIGDCRDSVTMAATDFSHPYLASFSDPGVDSINSRRVFRRLELGALHKDARLIAAFSDGRPALIAAPVGRGQAVLLAFSPARAWGQFGTQAAPMIVLLQTILEHLSPPPEDVGSYTAGQRVSIALAGAADGLRAVSDADGTARLLSLSGATAQIPTDSAGNFRVPADDEPAVTLRRYSVNVSERESAAGRLDPSAIQEALAPAEVIVTADPLGLGKPWNTAHQGRELLVPQSLALLALLFVESLFANRFYRRQPDRVTSP